MRVLIIVDNSPQARYLVNLYTKTLISEIKDLITERKYAKAIATAFSKGSFEREIHVDEMHTLETDLILSQSTASWDLM